MSLPKSFPLKAAHGTTIDIPSVGYGTWADGDKQWAKDATLTALKEGYRHIDGAWYYGVSEHVGQAIKESGVPREEIFVTSKAWPQFLSPEHVELCLDKILADSQLDYIDLYLAHWPVSFVPISRSSLESARIFSGAGDNDKGFNTKDGKPIINWAHTSSPIARKAGQSGSFVETWKAMQALVATGKCRAVGVSNFSIADLEELLPYSSVPDDVPISCNQIEVHPWLPQTELIEFGKKHDILTTCYSPFAGQKSDGQTLLKDEKVVELARKNGMDVGQLLQSWAVQRGTVPLGKSATPSRIKSNLEVRKLSEEDMQVLDGMEVAGGEGRTVKMKGWGVEFF